MLQRMAVRMVLVCGLALAGPGSMIVGDQPAPRQATRPDPQAERSIRRQTLDIEIRREIRDQAELVELIRRLIRDGADEVTGLAAKRHLHECQQKRQLSEQALFPPPADARRLCEPNTQLWSML